MVQNINSSRRNVLFNGPSRGGMFGCMAAQAHIIVVETHPQTILNIVREGLDESSSRAVIPGPGATFACATMRTSTNRVLVSQGIVVLRRGMSPGRHTDQQKLFVFYPHSSLIPAMQFLMD